MRQDSFNNFVFYPARAEQYEEVSLDQAVKIIADYMFYVLEKVPGYADPPAAERDYFAVFEPIRKAMRENNPEEAAAQAFAVFMRNNVKDCRKLSGNKKLYDAYAKLKQ